jgi:hypothetical protein
MDESSLMQSAKQTNKLKLTVVNNGKHNKFDYDDCSESGAVYKIKLKLIVETVF